MKRPNFFIIGAPKSGTTALYSYLRLHPNVFMPSSMKEPHFFSTDLHNRDSIQTCDEYLRLFEDAEAQHHAVGEGSTGYLFSRRAAENIRQFDQRARLIVMLRNPLELAPSMHSQMLYQWIEDVQDFEAAWRLQDRRRQGECLPGTAKGEKNSPHQLQYGDVCKLGSQMQRLFDVFPRKQVMVILHEKFKVETRDVYEQVLAFLGVESDGRTDFPRENANRVHRYPTLMKLMMSPPEPLNSIKKGLRNLFGLKTAGLGWKLYSRFAVPASRPALRPEFERELCDYFRSDVELLQDIIGENLSHWLGQRQRACA